MSKVDFSCLLWPESSVVGYITISILFKLRVDCDSPVIKNLRVRVVEEDPIANVEFRNIDRPTEEYLLGKLHLTIPRLRLERPVRHTFLF